MRQVTWRTGSVMSLIFASCLGAIAHAEADRDFNDAVRQIQVEIDRSPRLDGCDVSGIRHTVTADDPVGRYMIQGTIAEESQRELIQRVVVGVLAAKVASGESQKPIVDESRLVLSPRNSQTASRLYVEGREQFRCGYINRSVDQMQRALDSFSAARRHEPLSPRIAYWRMLTMMYLGHEHNARELADVLQERKVLYGVSEIRSMEMVQGVQRFAFHEILKEHSLLAF